MPPQNPVAPSGSQQPVTRSSIDAELALQKKRDRKIIIVAALIGLFLNALYYIPLVLLLVFASTVHMKQISFDNGKDATYKLKFYRDYEVRSSELQNSKKKLVSKVSKDGKAPVTLYLSKESTNTKKWETDASKTCTGEAPPKALEVWNPHINDTITLCDATDKKMIDDSVMYIGGFKSGNNVHAVIVLQDIDLSKLITEQQMNEAKPKLGLSTYNEDIKTIVASIDATN